MNFADALKAPHLRVEIEGSFIIEPLKFIPVPGRTDCAPDLLSVGRAEPSQTSAPCRAGGGTDDGPTLVRPVSHTLPQREENALDGIAKSDRFVGHFTERNI